MVSFRNMFERLLSTLFALSYEQIFLLSIGNIAAFAFVFLVLSYIPFFHMPGISGTSFVERIIVLWHYSTSLASNTGVGDVGTALIYKVLASFEMIIGIFLFAFVITKFTSRHTERVLQATYEMGLEATYRDVYEQLYISRKKLNAVIERSTAAGILEGETALLFRLVCLEISAALMAAPQLLFTLSVDSELDRDRQEIITAVIRRTLHRLSHTVHVLETLPQGAWRTEETVRYVHRALNSYTMFYERVAPELAAKNPQCTSYLDSALDIVTELEQSVRV